MVKRFSAKVAEHTRRYRARMEFAFRQSVQDTMEIAQTPQPSVKVTGGSFELGKIPVDTGFLRNSLIAGINGGIGQYIGPESYLLAIEAAELGDTIQVGWTAEYALYVEYGNSRMDGRFYARGAAQQWQATVDRNAELAKQI